jgi:hypothetical protein
MRTWGARVMHITLGAGLVYSYWAIPVVSATFRLTIPLYAGLILLTWGAFPIVKHFTDKGSKKKSDH